VICNNPIRAKFILVTVNTVATECHVLNISIAALFENEELRLQLSFLDIKISKQTTHWTSIRIVIMKRKFIQTVQTLQTFHQFPATCQSFSDVFFPEMFQAQKS